MEQWKIARINALAHKAKSAEGLTDAEIRERRQLRREYIQAVTGSLSEQLDRVYFVEKDGSQTKLQKKAEPSHHSSKIGTKD